MGKRLEEIQKIVEDYQKQQKEIDNKLNNVDLLEKIEEINKKLRPSELHIQRLEEELENIPSSEKDLIAEYKKKIEQEKNPKLQGEEGFNKDAHYDLERRKYLDEKKKLEEELSIRKNDKDMVKANSVELLDLETKQRAILTQESIAIDNDIKKVELNMQMVAMDLHDFKYEYEEKDGMRIPKNGDEYRKITDKYTKLQDELQDLKEAKKLCEEELKKFQEKDAEKMKSFTKAWNDVKESKVNDEEKKKIIKEKSKEQQKEETPRENGKSEETPKENGKSEEKNIPNLSKSSKKSKLDITKSEDRSIRKITCEVGLGRYFVELNDGTVETVKPNVLNKKQAKEIFKLYNIDQKSNIDPNIISILLNYSNKDLIGNPEAFIQEYAKNPNRDFQVVYSDKLTSRHGKIMIGKEVLEDSSIGYLANSEMKQDIPVKPLKRFEKRFLRKMALKQEEFENTFIIMDKRNFLQKMSDKVLSKIGKEPKFLPEITKDNERLNAILNSRRTGEISDNINSKINSSLEERVGEVTWDEEVRYDDRHKDIRDELNERDRFLLDYKCRNVRSKDIFVGRYENEIRAYDELDKEIINEAKKGYADRQNDPYLKTKEMLDRKIKKEDKSKDDDEER